MARKPVLAARRHFAGATARGGAPTTQAIQHEKMHGRDRCPEHRDQTGAEQTRQPVGGVQQPVGRHQQAGLVDQCGQQRLQGRLKECLANRQYHDGEQQHDGRRVARRRPDRDQRQQHRAARQIGADHGATTIPAIGDPAADGCRQQHDGGPRRPEIPGRRAEHADRHPAEGHGIELVAKRGKCQRRPDPRHGAVAQRGENTQTDLMRVRMNCNCRRHRRARQVALH
jgi:hypothetical protein